MPLPLPLSRIELLFKIASEMPLPLLLSRIKINIATANFYLRSYLTAQQDRVKNSNDCPARCLQRHSKSNSWKQSPRCSILVGFKVRCMRQWQSQKFKRHLLAFEAASVPFQIWLVQLLIFFCFFWTTLNYCWVSQLKMFRIITS